MAQSLKLSPFTSLGTANNVISDDYVHGNFSTIKLKGSSTNGSKFDYKIKVKAEVEDGDFTGDVSDEGKVQFPVCDKYVVQLGQRRNGSLRAHLDLGQYSILNKSWNFFTNLKTNTTFSEFQFRLGANYFGPKCESNTRVEIISKSSPVLTHRNYVSNGNLYYGFVASLGVKKFPLLKYDALVGYTKDKVEVNLKHKSPSKPSSLNLGNLALTGTYQVDTDTKVAIEVQNDGTNFDPQVTVGAQKKFQNGATLKGKINKELDLSLAAKYALNSQFTLTGALQLAFKGDLVNLDKLPPLPLGFQLDVNL